MENNNKFKVWDKESKKWANPEEFFMDSDGILSKMDSGVLTEAPKEYISVKATTLEDEWEKQEDEIDNKGIIYEGDYVYLHNWGHYSEQVIGIAEVIWDKEYNKWTYEMIEGGLQDEYDRNRQSPKVMANKYENLNFEYSKDWTEFLKREEKEAELKQERKELLKKKKELNKEKREHDNKIKEI